jgi:dolichol-phosphate mannosyltransferase
MKDVLIVIPTFNEKENISKLIDEITKQKLGADILVVDDNSPDATGKIVDEIAKTNHSVFVLHREEKAGLGRAYVAGFKWGLEKGYKKMISMDADFSHPVAALNRLITLCSSKSVAIGSRYIKGGRIEGWKWHRYANSWGANYVTRGLLRIKAKDATAGFKCYPREFLEEVNLDTIQASGYAFQVEMLLKAQELGYRLVETPITFVDRRAGESKIQGELKKSAKTVFSLASQKKSYRQFIKFAIVGASCAIVDWAVFYIFKAVLFNGFPSSNSQLLRQIAKGISFIVSASVNYYFNRKWTFRSEDKAIAKQLTKFFIVATAGLIFNSLIFYLVTALLGWRDIFGLLIATAIVTVWNFIINRIWTFKEKK